MKSSVSIYDSRIDEPNITKLNFSQIAYQWYENKMKQIRTNAAYTGQVGDIDNVAKTDNDIVNNDGRNLAWGGVEQNEFGLNTINRAADIIADNNPDQPYEQVKINKKWPSSQNENTDGQFYKNFDNIFNRMMDQQNKDSRRKRRMKRTLTGMNGQQRVMRRHVGLHNGDKIQRVISTGKLIL